MSLPSLVALPPSLLPFVSRAEESFLSAAGSLSEAIAARCRAWLTEHHDAFARVCAASDFVSEQVSRDPQMLLQLAERGWLDRSFAPTEMRDALNEQIAACDNEDALALTLRRFRTRQQVRIIWRDLTRQADLAETCRDLSDLADASVDLAYHWLYTRHCGAVRRAYWSAAAARRSTWSSLAWASWAPMN